MTTNKRLRAHCPQCNWWLVMDYFINEWFCHRCNKHRIAKLREEK